MYTCSTWQVQTAQGIIWQTLKATANDLVFQVCENDILLVDVVNRVPGQGFGIHWRGQPQKETPVMDGVPMVTQCPIPSSTTFQYKFRASRAGTHLWHAFTGTVFNYALTKIVYSKPSSNSEDMFIESGAFGESALDELNIEWG
jgi:FtsP/CotA-like multicopper oxidase with cupredoxin domain